MRLPIFAKPPTGSLALQNPHNGGQVPMLAPQTLLTSTVASFQNPSIRLDEAEASATPELIFVPSPIAWEPESEGEITGPSLLDSEAVDPIGDASDGSDGRGLEDLVDLWMVEKIRTASATLSSLISDLYWKRFGSGTSGTPSEKWTNAPGRMRSWVAGTSCSWLGLCENARASIRIHNAKESEPPWVEGKSKPGDWVGDERVLSEVPSYVHEHAPYVHLFSKEKYWPSDMGVHLDHITPRLNYTPILPSSEHPTLMNLDELNQWEQGLNVFLTSNDDVEMDPDWLRSRVNIPQPLPGDDEHNVPRAEAHAGECDGDLLDDINSPEEYRRDEHDGVEASAGDADFDTDPKENVTCWPRKRPMRGKPGKSKAPAVLIVVDKGEGIVDAFWFYFYSFNQGNEVLNIRFGNHVGDWEHTLVRFENGQPKIVFCSEHSFGEAFTYEAAEKIGKRPVVYSATGSHAMYSSPGIHDYILPFGLLHDETDRGPLWDPSLNNLAYTYDYKDDLLLASTSNPQAPTSWFYFAGKWGDKLYPLSDNRQYAFAGQYHYVNGPLGPRFKNLGRKNVCQGDDDPCFIKRVIGGDTRSYRWNGVGEGEETGDEDYHRFFGKEPSVEAPPPLDG
ncbi:Vacuolar protein sorting-associated protein 62 [Arachnomyces sp. PD_36]|nr:Vacuolar protein sorting-associated protein 62 [Arachnomyces sp. PD_36]